ncbi:MAG TPA: helix-hairpin-helix domain-containing protein [Bacillota bacterium]|nr:helix-hairpin-helix domain-containing protein [Bacillota bacterium]
MNFGWTKREKKLALIFLCGLFFLVSLYFYDHSKNKPSSFTPTITSNLNELTPPSKVEKTKEEEKSVSISVDIKGAVVHPDVYPLKKGARVYELIRLAGGLLPEADNRLINQAKEVRDGDMIYIPSKGEKLDLPMTSLESPGQSNEGKLIHVNTAAADELSQLPGIGEAKAKAILQYRTSHGPFQTKEDLKKVNGIGDKLFERMKESISID